MVEKLATLAKKRVLRLWGKVGTFDCEGNTYTRQYVSLFILFIVLLK